MFNLKRKGKKNNTDQEIPVKPPAIQVDKSPDQSSDVLRSEPVGRTVRDFFRNLRPSASRSVSRERSGDGEPRKSQEIRIESNTSPGISVKFEEQERENEDESSKQGTCEEQSTGIDAIAVGPGAPWNDISVKVEEVATSNSTEVDKRTVQDTLNDAEKQVKSMTTLTGAANKAAELGGQANTVLPQIDDVSKYLEPLKIFDTVVKGLGDIHPYAKIALSTLSWASKALIAQAKRDESIGDLQSKVSEVYHFMTEDGQLEKIVWMKETLAQTAQVVLECAKFICTYSQPNFVHRLGKNMFSSTEDIVTKYDKALDRLMQRFQQGSIRTVLTATHDIQDIIKYLGDEMHLNEIEYAKGAGMDTTKACLEGTRQEILDEIVDWVNRDGENVPPVLWLSGPAGTGKSAIAHTIARSFKDSGSLGSCFCFKRGEEKRAAQLFPTVARDLAVCNLALRQALATVVARDPSLGTTIDVYQQWLKLVLEPISVSASDMVGRIIIVIDALDESGDENSRKHILNILGNEIAGLPDNFRILITSRPLHDIQKTLNGVAHVEHMSMDGVPVESTTRDIRLYVSSQLSGCYDSFDDEEIAKVANKSDGLFEWARLACDYISSTKAGESEKERFDDLILLTSGEGSGLLDGMYKIILREIMGQRPTERALVRFRSVMRQVLFTLEPLPLDSLTIMHRAVQNDGDRYNAGLILKPMASLLSGIYDENIAIRPLHSSFHDFLVDQSRSSEFFVNEGNVHLNLALASLHIMQQELCFNICKLESSYMRNSQVENLSQRVKKHISIQLSYSCCHLASHVEATTFSSTLADALAGFIYNKQILFWLEVLSLLQLVKLSPKALTIIVSWLENHANYEHAITMAKEGILFARTFGSIISESTPHLYLSALPFLPINSAFSQVFTKMFQNIAQVTSGGLQVWASPEYFLAGHQAEVWSVAFSPDGKYVASGSDDKSICIWDTEIGMQVGSSLKGHNGGVESVAFSPDGKLLASGSADGTIYIWDRNTGFQIRDHLLAHSDVVWSIAFSPDGGTLASGSGDKTICIWDLKVGKQVGDHLRGHVQGVQCTAYSPDGNWIVSGSDDKTIRIWDAKKHLQIGTPFEGHTGGVLSVVFSPDGEKIISGSEDRTICIWDVKTGLPIGKPLKHAWEVNSVAIASNGQWFVSASGDSNIQVWDAKDGTPLGVPLQKHHDSLTSVAISPDCSKIASGAYDNCVYIGNMEGLLASSSMIGHSNMITSVAVSPDGEQLASSSFDKTVCIWDAKTGLQIHDSLREHKDGVLCVAFSPNGQKIVSCSMDKTICIWDAKNGTLLGNPLKGHTDEVNSVAFSPCGQKVVSGSDDMTICIWDINTGLPIASDSCPSEVGSVSFSPDCERIISGLENGTIHICSVSNTENGLHVINTLKGHMGIAHAAFSPDGSRIVSGAADETICIWDAITGLQLGSSIKGHAGEVHHVAFSPDGTRIVSCSNDETVQIWNVETGLQMGSPLKGHVDGVTCAAFFPDGKHVVSCSCDGSIRVWNTEEDTSSSGQITLSSCANHALQNTGRFFDGTSFLKEDWRDCFELNNEGWIVGPEDHLLIWVPMQFHKLLHMPGTELVIPGPAVELDLSRMAHGDRWFECYNLASSLDI